MFVVVLRCSLPKKPYKFHKIYNFRPRKPNNVRPRLIMAAPSSGDGMQTVTLQELQTYRKKIEEVNDEHFGSEQRCRFDDGLSVTLFMNRNIAGA